MTDLSLDALAQAWERHDPAPAGLVDRVLVSLAMERLDEDYELLHLVKRSTELVGARHGAGSPLTISFAGDDVSLLLRVSTVGGQRRIDGWLAPAQEAQVAVRGVGREWRGEVDAHGRFVILSLPAGLVRIVVETIAGDGASEPSTVFATPAVEL